MTDFSKVAVVLPKILDIENLDVKVLLDINVDNLEETMQYQPTLYCTIGLYARKAESVVAELKGKIELLESRIRAELDFQFAIDKKRLVSATIKQSCNASPEYNKYQEELRQAEYAAKVFATIEESFKQRFGMIQQIAKRRSNELTQLI